MEIHQSTVILLLVLCVSLSTYGQPADVRVRYNKFLNQHVFGQMTEKRCDGEIHKRGISRGQTDNECKEVNSFIQANSNEVKTVCESGGKRTKDERFYVSSKPFNVITCKLKSGERHPNCKYRGKKSTRYIVVACDQGWPIHYEEGLIVTG